MFSAFQIFVALPLQVIAKMCTFLLPMYSGVSFEVKKSFAVLPKTSLLLRCLVVNFDPFDESVISTS